MEPGFSDKPHPSGVFCPVTNRLLVWLLVVVLLSQMVLPTLLEMVEDESPVGPPASAPLSSCPPMEPSSLQLLLDPYATPGLEELIPSFPFEMK